MVDFYKEIVGHKFWHKYLGQKNGTSNGTSKWDKLIQTMFASKRRCGRFLQRNDMSQFLAQIFGTKLAQIQIQLAQDN